MTATFTYPQGHIIPHSRRHQQLESRHGQWELVTDGSKHVDRILYQWCRYTMPDSDIGGEWRLEFNLERGWWLSHSVHREFHYQFQLGRSLCLSLREEVDDLIDAFRAQFAGDLPPGLRGIRKRSQRARELVDDNGRVWTLLEDWLSRRHPYQWFAEVLYVSGDWRLQFTTGEGWVLTFRGRVIGEYPHMHLRPAALDRIGKLIDAFEREIEEARENASLSL